MFPEGPTWAPEFLVDGFSSRHELIGLAEWLRGLERRGRLQRLLDELLGLRAQREEAVRSWAVNLGAAAAVLFAGGFLFAIFYSWWKRERQIRELRRRLAQDLHDEIGSSLGSIRLNSQIAQTLGSVPEEVSERLQQIEQAAATTAESMRDIIWLLDGRQAGSAELVRQMRDVAHRLLDGTNYSLDVSGDCKDFPLTLEFRRNVLFAFKEALYNAVRHSEARHIQVKIRVAGGQLNFEVKDDGCGCPNPDSAQGHGLENIRCRARHLKGYARFISRMGAGSSLLFRVPVR